MSIWTGWAIYSATKGRSTLLLCSKPSAFTTISWMMTDRRF